MGRREGREDRGVKYLYNNNNRPLEEHSVKHIRRDGGRENGGGGGMRILR